MPFLFDQNEAYLPGLESVLETVQNQYWWGSQFQQTFIPIQLSSAAVDSGNTVTTTLRGGLLLGRITATGLWKQWNPTGTDGSEVLAGILPAPISMTSTSGSVANRYTYAHIAGNAMSARLIVPGNAAESIVGDALEFQVVNQLSGRFLLDQHYLMDGAALGRSRFRYLTAAEITADAVTVTTAEHGRTFLMTGADGNTTFTLPAAQVGLTYIFMANIATQNCVIALASGSIKLADADGTATGCTLQPGESAMFIGTAAGIYQMFAATEATTD